MRQGSGWAFVTLAALLVSSGMLSPAGSKSSNPCADCHQSYNMYLDILEGDPGNSVPAALGDGETLTVAVVLKVTSNSPKYQTMSSITATLAPQKGLFSVVVPTYVAGSLSNRQTATATWQIRPMKSGTDVLLISAHGVDRHGPSYFTDTYSPAPAITVTKTATDLAPTISLLDPAEGVRLSGGRPAAVSWTATDEDLANCSVGLYYSTDGFATVNRSIAAGLPADRDYCWTTPLVDSDSVRLKATVVDRRGNFNETVSAGPFAVDSTPPAVTGVLPANGSTELTDSALLQVRFSEPVDESTAGPAFSITPDPGGLGWSWNDERTAMTSSHRPFDPGTAYACRLGPGLGDLSAPGNANGTAYSWSFKTPERFVPTPSIAVSEPSGGERYYWGDRVNISWMASGGVGELTIDLAVSENGTAGPFLEVATGLPNRGSFGIPVPELVSDNCLFGITVTDGNGTAERTQSGLFSVARDLRLEAGLPPAGASFPAGSSTTVNWSATGGHGEVSAALYYQPGPDAAAQVVQLGMPRTGSRRWTAPEDNTATARLVLNVTDGWGRSVEAVSGALVVFSRNPPRAGPGRPPVVTIGVDGERNRAGDLLAFDASGSFDPDGDILHFIWYFGDGSSVLNTTAPLVQHVYKETGDYTLVLEAGDGTQLTVQEMPLHIEAQPSAGPTGGEGRPVMLSGAAVIIAGSAGLALAVRPAAGGRARGGPTVEPRDKEA